MSCTAQTIHRMIWFRPSSGSVNPRKERSEKNRPGGKALDAYAEEIEDRLRTLGPVIEKHQDVDYRSCFSKNGRDQLKIQVRLKQVAGGLKG